MPNWSSLKHRWTPIVNLLKQDTIAYFLLLGFSLLLRFWGLGRFNTLVFDEVYFANYGYNYLHHIPFFDIHPPLGKLLIALGLHLAHFFSWGKTIVTTTENWSLPSWHYRWFNAAIGSLIPLLGAALIQTVTRRKCYGLIAGFLLALDGLLLVESRYALINIYLIFFGLLGHYFFFQALLSSPPHQTPWKRSVGFTLAGLSLGACVSVKWNGLGFLLALYGLWGVGMLSYFWRSFHQSILKDALKNTLKNTLKTQLFPRFLHRLQPKPNESQSAPNLTDRLPAQTTHNPPPPALLQKISLLRPYHLFLYFGILPAIVYRLQWIPHLQISQDFNFWEVHRQIWSYNTNLGAGEKVHPYCSTWNTWPWLIRPIAYFFKEIKTPAEADLFGLSSTHLPRIYDVHAIGNPFLWWCSTLTVLGLVIILYGSLVSSAQQSFTIPLERSLPRSEQDLLIYLLISYAANWLPWALVSRCLYLYHYMPASLFSFFALGWCIDRGLRSHHRFWQVMAWGVLALVLFSFIYWLPIFLGLSVPPEAFHQRMWFRSWY